jgi:hypothetical protein
MDEQGSVYLANPESGTIQVYRDGKLSYFAGIENEKAFIDGSAPLFFMPQAIKYSDGFLYVWDFNILRRIEIIGKTAGECITIAGEASPEFDMEITQTTWAAEDIVLPNSKLMDFAVTDEGILLTDPMRGVVWWVDSTIIIQHSKLNQQRGALAHNPLHPIHQFLSRCTQFVAVFRVRYGNE